MLLFKISISASACDFSSLIFISMLERSCNDRETAAFSAADRLSSWFKFATFASNSCFIFSNCFVFARTTSCTVCSCSSFKFRI
ncbi:hypothetical protein HanPSC8_Chr13g0545231 [Helianthus annuus]|nr:hypothetical protein HanPSC8_Chr13g0545231 [Helianthus annuus]